MAKSSLSGTTVFVGGENTTAAKAGRLKKQSQSKITNTRSKKCLFTVNISADLQLFLNTILAGKGKVGESAGTKPGCRPEKQREKIIFILFFSG